MQGIYVVGDLAGLLRRYLDAERIDAPRVRRSLSAIAPHSRMSMQLWWSLLEQIQELQPVPALGLRIGRHVRPADSGVLGYLIMYCDTLGEALQRFQRYQGLLHNLSRLELEATPGRLSLSWDTERGLSTQLSDEVFMSGLITVVRQLTQRPDLRPLRLRFNHRVAFDSHDYEDLAGCPVEFGCERVALEVPQQALGWPINSRDPHLLALLERQAAALLGPDSAPDAFLADLQQVLAELLGEGQATLDAAARRMLLSSRTLHRRLAERETSFSAVLRQTREKLTELYLNDPALSLQEIAFLLGYTEQSAFSRACRHWFGQSPRTLRAALRENPT